MPVERIGKPPKNTGNARNADGEYLCPVLARPVTDFSPGNSFTYKGRAYFFGSPDCRVCFEADPERYIKAIKAGKVGGARVKLPESDGTE